MSQPLIIDGNGQRITITHHSLQRTTQHPDGSTTIEIDSAPGSPFTRLVVNDDNKKLLFTAPDGPTHMWHAVID